MFDISSSTLRIPVLPIRDKVVFPGLTVSLIIGRDRSVRSVQSAIQKDKLVFIVTQRHLKIEEPGRGDLFEFGTLAEIIQSITLPDGLLRVRVVGKSRAKLMDLSESTPHLVGDVELIEEPSVSDKPSLEMEALRRMILRKFEEYLKRVGRIPAETFATVAEMTTVGGLVDAAAEAMLIGVEEKQDLLELVDISRRAARLVEILNGEIEILQIERKIQSRVHKQIEKNQREYYLNEQMRAIQKELKKSDEVGQEADDFKKKIKDAKMPPEAEEAALKEAGRLEKMMPFSPESTVVRSYLEWMISLPWSIRTKDNLDVKAAQKILDEDHFGLEKPKERILEYLAVLKLTKSIKGPILCFVGPPGTGKTSLAKSLARAMGRTFYRISLGGVRDEAEIRGHRRTYIGSLPGRLIQALRKTKSKNPLILLDEIDKMGTDWRGDPAAALLEVLDPEQNKSFTDHYLDTGFDLSEVLFIGTANSLYGIPPTLLDRLEVIRYSAYTTEEKVSIANKFVLPKELKEHGLPASALKIDDEAMRKIVHTYTQEAGVRELQRKIAKLCRKIAVEWVGKSNSKKTVQVGLKDLTHYLGVPDFIREKISVNAVGIATGLAWTDHGGETLTIEVTTMPGEGKILLTGKLGSVMQESAQTAYSLIKSRTEKFRLSSPTFRKMDLHVHVPEGAVPKDGPSAGIAMATAILSAITGRPVKKDIAMTGEVTLRGRVLPIGGLKEKALAAYREGIHTIVFPKGNEKDLPEIPETVRKAVKMVPVQQVDEVFEFALQPSPVRSAASHRRSSVNLHTS